MPGTAAHTVAWRAKSVNTFLFAVQLDVDKLQDLTNVHEEIRPVVEALAYLGQEVIFVALDIGVRRHKLRPHVGEVRYALRTLGLL